MLRCRQTRTVLSSFCKRRYNGPIPKQTEARKSAVSGQRKEGGSMFNPRNGMIFVSLLGAGLAANVMLTERKEEKKEKIIEKIPVSTVQKEIQKPKPPRKIEKMESRSENKMLTSKGILKEEPRTLKEKPPRILELKDKEEEDDDREALTRQVALQATLAASMGILAGVSYHLLFDRR